MERQRLIQIRRLLVEISDDPAEIRNLARDAGLTIARINLSGSPTNMWHAILEEAQKTAHVEALVDHVTEEIPKAAVSPQLRELVGLPPLKTTEHLSEPTSNRDTPENSSSQDPQPTQPTPKIEPPLSTPRNVEIETPRTIHLRPIERQLLGTLFANARRVKVLNEFSEGRTESRVFLVQPVDHENIEELPTVVKTANRLLIEEEWQATQKYILRRLPGFAPVQDEPVYLKAGDGVIWGALRYAQVGDSVFPVKSLAEYSTAAPPADLWRVLQTRLSRQLHRFWQSTQARETFTFRSAYDTVLPVNLLVEPLRSDASSDPPISLNGNEPIDSMLIARLRRGATVQVTNFTVTELSSDRKTITLNLPQPSEGVGPSFRIRVRLGEADTEAQIGSTYSPIAGTISTTQAEDLLRLAQTELPAFDLTASSLRIENTNDQLPNPLLAIPGLLARSTEGWFATIHGDLNLRNILVDPDVGTTAIIDCAAAQRSHVLRDLLCMEREIVIDLLTTTFFQHHLPPTAMIQFYRCLHCALQGPVRADELFSLPDQLDPALRKYFIMLVTLRRMAREYLDGTWHDYYVGLTLYLLGALKFSNLNEPPAGEKPRAVAFWGAAATLQILQEVAAGDNRLCDPFTWTPFNIVSGTFSEDDALESMSPSDDLGIKSPVTSDISSTESPEASSAASGPVQRRLDVATPEQARLNHPFSLAVAVRQSHSSQLDIVDLPNVHSGNAQLDWPPEVAFVRVRVQIIATGCEIVGDTTQSIKLYRGLDSEIYYFSLIPKMTGTLDIIVRMYQEEDLLGSARVQTTVNETLVGEVKVQLKSEEVAVNNRPERSITTRGTRDIADERRIKILFLGANPQDTVQLRTGEEARAIDRALRETDHRIFDIVVHQAVRTSDLAGLLMRYRPDIVHFSGHGTPDNRLVFLDAQGNSLPVEGSTLRQLFSILKDNVRCILLNACYSTEQASKLAEVIDCVVGVGDAIEDDASIQFATAFYLSLGYGRSVQDAFSLGQVQIAMAGLGDATALHLLERATGTAGYIFTGNNGRTTPVVESTATPSAPTITTTTADTEFLQSLLAQHQRNLQLLQRQKANYGAGEEPLRLLNQIATEEEEIARLEAQLRGE